MLYGIECVVFGADDFVERGSQTWQKIFLPSFIHPFDENTLMTAGQKKRTLRCKLQTEHRQRMPVQCVSNWFYFNLWRRRVRGILLASCVHQLCVGIAFSFAIGAEIVVPEEYLTLNSASRYTILIWMYGQTCELFFGFYSWQTRKKIGF